MIYILVAFILFLAVPLAIGLSISAPGYKGNVSDHFDGKKFINPGNAKAKGFGDVLKWIFSRKRGYWPKGDFSIGPKPALQVNDGIKVTFVNHSTFLLQFDNINILTDPVWSTRVSPFSWAGPARKRPPGILFEDLPKIDFILLSHNHWDHLDIDIVESIWRRHKCKIVVPLGVGLLLSKRGIDTLPELDWWKEISLREGLVVQAVPAQHFSGRGMADRDKTLWAGYVLKRARGDIYFAGDTGYNQETFKAIGRVFPELRLSIIPIGAYRPEWFMSPIHCSPAEAVEIHLDVRSQQSIACHFGTFQLADDGLTEPVDALREAMTERGVDEGKFLVLKEGEPTKFN